MVRLSVAEGASLSSAKLEVERIDTRIKKLLNPMLDDEMAVDEGKAEIEALDRRRKELQAQFETADQPPPMTPHHRGAHGAATSSAGFRTVISLP